jgi:hypothetical protein
VFREVVQRKKEGRLFTGESKTNVIEPKQNCKCLWKVGGKPF